MEGELKKPEGLFQKRPVGFGFCWDTYGVYWNFALLENVLDVAIVSLRGSFGEIRNEIKTSTPWCCVESQGTSCEQNSELQTFCYLIFQNNTILHIYP